jgi:hypothetical protein
MKVPFLAAMILAATLLSHDQSAVAQDACGPRNVSFSVKLETASQPSKPEVGQALVYFVQDIDESKSGGIITRIALDGHWVGAVKDNSYLAIPVQPGEHHICAILQMNALQRSIDFASPKPALAHFQAKSEGVYYFRARYITAKYLTMEFGPADADQALYMISFDPRSLSRPRK